MRYRRVNAALAAAVLVLAAAACGSPGGHEDTVRPPATAVTDGGGQESPSPGDPDASGTPDGSTTTDPGRSGSGGTSSSGPGSTRSPDPEDTGSTGPGKGSSTRSSHSPGSGGKSGPCGLPSPPTGTTGGRRTQTVVFPGPGTAHTYPHTSVALHACATSGLPVRYALADEFGDCRLTTANGTTSVTIGNSTTGKCTVLASQDGDATWAPAGPVRGDFAVGYQVVSLSWADARQPMRYPSAPVAVRIHVSSPDPFKGGLMNVTAEGACALVDTPQTIGVNDPIVTVKVRPSKPSGAFGVCRMNGSMASDHTATRVYLPERAYTVTASGSAVPSA
ncbi:hypothetical protein [Streptomyces crystallinus]|uniref:Uncharacterized protein n=1 Tax=Streptomyces crystallinus TaxID=68191 RepID=A0ABN1FE40_9ACTN